MVQVVKSLPLFGAAFAYYNNTSASMTGAEATTASGSATGSVNGSASGSATGSGAMVSMNTTSGVPVTSSAAGNANGTVITTTVTELTTYCPEPTTIVTNGKTYTVTEATTLTITDCPCVLTTTIPGTKPGVVTGTTSGAASGSKIEQDTTYTTVVSSYVTVCPEPTTFSRGTKTYTATRGETITVTDCPCTLTSTMTEAKPTGTKAESMGPQPTDDESMGPKPTEAESMGTKSIMPLSAVTTVVYSYTTVCPTDTTIIHGDKTITATSGQTVTVTDCPCTLTSNVPASGMITSASGSAPVPAKSSGQMASEVTSDSVQAQNGASKAIPALGMLLPLIQQLL